MLQPARGFQMLQPARRGFHMLQPARGFHIAVLCSENQISSRCNHLAVQ